jgi:hypothetical protein
MILYSNVSIKAIDLIKKQISMMINKCFDARKFMINFFISVANNIKVSL